MSREGRTGLVLPVPEADPVLTTVRQGFPGALLRENPAHISLLYPFLDAAAVDERTVDALDGIVRAQGTASLTLAECRREEDGFVYLPADSTEVAALADAVRTRWPDVAPHEGRGGVTAPHVTVASGVAEETATQIQTTVTGVLPVLAVLEEVWLVVFTGGQWQVRERFLFADDEVTGAATS
ncbi:2'-5' RNA ligase family protein [Salinifilum aidingensis]